MKWNHLESYGVSNKSNSCKRKLPEWFKLVECTRETEGPSAAADWTNGQFGLSTLAFPCFRPSIEVDLCRFKLQGLSIDRGEEALGRSTEKAELVANANIVLMDWFHMDEVNMDYSRICVEKLHNQSRGKEIEEYIHWSRARGFVSWRDNDLSDSTCRL